jgi:hypothetical protein
MFQQRKTLLIFFILRRDKHIKCLKILKLDYLKISINVYYLNFNTYTLYSSAYFLYCIAFYTIETLQLIFF